MSESGFGLTVGLLGIIVGVVGLLAGLWWTRRQTIRSARSALHVRLNSSFELCPSAYQPDLSKTLKVSWAGAPIDNFVCLALALRLDGYHDLDDPSAKQPPGPGAPSRPRIDFSNFRVLSIGTVDNDPNSFEIPIAKASGDKSIFLNVVRLRANFDARFLVMGTKLNEQAPIGARLVPGFMKQIDIKGAGMLHL